MRHDDNNFESSVVIQEQVLAIKRALYGLLWSLGNQYNVVFFNTNSKLSGCVVAKLINHKFLIRRNLWFVGICIAKLLH